MRDNRLREALENKGVLVYGSTYGNPVVTSFIKRIGELEKEVRLLHEYLGVRHRDYKEKDELIKGKKKK